MSQSENTHKSTHKENIREEYESYLARIEQFRPHREPLGFEDFKRAYERWDAEYEAARDAGDLAHLLELEELLCV